MLFISQLLMKLAQVLFWGILNALGKSKYTAQWGAFGDSPDPNTLTVGQDVCFFPRADDVRKHTDLKEKNILGLPQKYYARIKSFNDDGSITITLRNTDGEYRVAHLSQLARP